MKKLTSKIVWKFVVAIMISLFILAASVQAQTNKEDKIINSKSYIKNLSACIASQNEGVKNMAIYFAGKYKVTGVTKALVKQLKKEESPKTRALIIYSLLMTGNDNGILAAYQYANGEMDEYIRKVFSDVTAEFDTVRSVAINSKDIQ